MTDNWSILFSLIIISPFSLLAYFYYKRIARRVERKAEKRFLFFLCLLNPPLFFLITLFMYRNFREFEVDGLCYAIRYIDEDFFVVALKKKSLFSKETYSGNVVIPEHITYDGNVYRVTTIEDSAFAYSTHLTSVTIPKSVTTIGHSAFEDCRELKDIYCLAEIVPDTFLSGFRTSSGYRASGTFDYLKQKNVTLHVPAASVQAYREDICWRKFGQIVAIEDTDECMKNVSET